MRLLSVNVSLPREVELAGGTRRTAILKVPVPGRVRVGRLGLEGDGVGNPKVHGGPWQAVYAMASEHVAHWREALGRHEVVPGFLGENFTIEGLLEDGLRLGDLLRIGSATFAISHPRRPCGTLEARIGERGFSKRFYEANRPGVYLRVVEEGDVGAGDDVTHEPRGADALTAARLFELRGFAGAADVSDLEMAAGDEELSPVWREEFHERLRRLANAGGSSGEPSS